MTKSQAINDIQELIDRSKQEAVIEQDKDFREWERDVRVVLRQIFGDDSEEVGEFAEISYSPIIYTESTTKSDILEMWSLGVKQAQAVLQSMIKQITKYGAKGITQEEIIPQESMNSEITENSREKNIRLLQEVIDEGKQMLEKDLQPSSNQINSWVIKVKDIIELTLGIKQAQEFSQIDFDPSYSHIRLGEGVNRFETIRRKRRSALRKAIAKLEAWLWSYTNLTGNETSSPVLKHTTQNSMITNKVFIVHGHDELTRHKVRTFLTTLGLDPIILQEKANKGQTIIEKFEANAQEIGFAVILLTADDEGRKKGIGPLKDRARQNVVFELGYFSHALGRGRVFCLIDEGVEIPSDYSGVVYEQLDVKGAWGASLAQELKAAGALVVEDKLIQALQAIR